MRLSGKFLLFIGIVVALGVIGYLTTSTYQRGSYYYYGIGLLDFKTGDFRNAGKYFEKSYNANNDNLMALYFLATSKVREGEKKKPRSNDDPLFRSAVANAEELTKKGQSRGDKNLYRYYAILARAEVDLEEYVAAKDAIDKAIKLKSTDYDIQVLLGRILIGQKEYERATDVLYDASQLKAFKPYEAYYYLGLAYDLARDGDRAYYYYDQAIKSFPSKEIKEEAFRRKLELANKP